MPFRRRLTLMTGAAVALLVPDVVFGQNAAIAATATVQPRPLTLRGAALTAKPGELRVRLDGCGSGALAVDVRTANATHRTSRAILNAISPCTARDVTLQLPNTVAGALAWVVTLEQSNALMSPAFAQFFIPVSAPGSRATVMY